ncbi:MAG TPA: radical SAM protein [Planctomycetota bacterium]|nr:radical SAM protein [Planctomycetota bacterium]
MKILLINPFVERMHLELSYAENFRPPLGLAYCASVLEAAGHTVEIIDALVQGIRFPKLRAMLRRSRPDLVGIGTYSPTRYECFRTAQVIKDELGHDVPVVAGGPHVSAVPEDTLREVPPIDHVVRGEGDYTLLELVEVLARGGDPASVAGVTTRVDGEVVSAPDRDNIPCLDELPRPARHLLPLRAYRLRMPSTSVAATTVLTSRGCPARCTFCTRDWFSRQTRMHSPEYIADEVEETLRLTRVRGVIFQDDTFTLDKQRVHGFCDEVRRRGVEFDWLATTRADCTSPELLKDMKAAGCKVVTFGIESMLPSTLKWIQKGGTVERTRRAIGWAREAGLIVRGSYLIGIGEESEQDVRESVRLARELPIDKLKANVGLSVYPGTPLYPMAIQAGILPEGYSYARGWQDPNLRYGNGETPRWYTPHVPLKRLLELRRETEVNVLFTRPSVRTLWHRGRKLGGRLRRHPRETLRQVSQLAGAVLGGSELRRHSSSSTQ